MATKNKIDLDWVRARIDVMPLLPAVICELLSLDTSSPHFFDRAYALIRRSPSLASKVLEIANSAQISPLNPITDIHGALVRIGMQKVISRIVMSSVAKVFTPSTDSQIALWYHSIQTAYLAEFLAQESSNLRIKADVAYTCGLLHDIGRFTLFEISSKAVDVIDARGWETPIELPEVEKSLLGFTHAEVGELSARKWQLPDFIVDIIKYHHQYDLGLKPDIPEKLKEMVLTIQLADIISVFLARNPNWKQWDKDDFQVKLANECLSKVQPQIEISIPMLINQIAKIDFQCDFDMKKLLL